MEPVWICLTGNDVTNGHLCSRAWGGEEMKLPIMCNTLKLRQRQGQKHRVRHCKHMSRGRNAHFKSHWPVSVRKLMGWAD